MLDAVPDRAAVDVDGEIRDFQDALSAVQVELRGGSRGIGARVSEDLVALYQAYSARQARDLWENALKEDSADRVREMLKQALDEKGLGGLVRPGQSINERPGIDPASVGRIEAL